MKKIDIFEQKKEGQLLVVVTYPLRTSRLEKQSMNTTDVVNFLKGQGYDNIVLLQSSSANNYNPNRLIGTWIFQLPQKKQLDKVEILEYAEDNHVTQRTDKSKSKRTRQYKRSQKSKKND